MAALSTVDAVELHKVAWRRRPVLLEFPVSVRSNLQVAFTLDILDNRPRLVWSDEEIAERDEGEQSR